MIGPQVPSSSRRELENAQAVAVNFRTFETRGEEEGGNIHQLINLIKGSVGNVLKVRVIREVTSDDSRMGKRGEIIDTTGTDNQFAGKDTRNPNHWYLGEGISPAITVIEISIEGGQADTRESVYRILKEHMDPMAAEMMLMMAVHPTAALPKAGMTPEEVTAFMKSNGFIYSDR